MVGGLRRNLRKREGIVERVRLWYMLCVFLLVLDVERGSREMQVEIVQPGIEAARVIWSLEIKNLRLETPPVYAAPAGLVPRVLGGSGLPQNNTALFIHIASGRLRELISRGNINRVVSHIPLAIPRLRRPPSQGPLKYRRTH